LATNVPLFALIYTCHLKNIPSNFQTMKSKYMDILKIWAKKCLELDLKEIDNEMIKEWMKAIAVNSQEAK